MSPSHKQRKQFIKRVFWAFMYINAAVILYKTGLFFYENGISYETITQGPGLLLMVVMIAVVASWFFEYHMPREEYGGLSISEVKQLVKDRNKQLEAEWKAKQRDPRW